MARHLFHLSDYPDLALQYRVHPDGDPTDEDCEVYAPCCGRRTIACAIADVRRVPNTIVAAGGIYEPMDHGWLCDACRARLFIEARPVRLLPSGAVIAWTESGLLAARGAPAQMIHEHQADEWRAEMVCRVRGEEHRPDDFYDLAMDRIVAIYRRRAEEDAYAD